MDKPGTIVIACAPNGAYKQKADHPSLPLQLNELVDSAVAVHAAGASMLHLHIREADGRHSLDPVLYQRTLDAIKDRMEDRLLLQITSEAGGRYLPPEQIAAIKAVKPEAVSIALREIITQASDIARATDLFHWLADESVLPQYILYSDQDVALYHQLLDQQAMPEHPHSVLFVLGRYQAQQQSSADDLAPFLESWSNPNIHWMVCAFGAAEQACLLASAQQGGHCRIGFENNLLKSNGEIATSNEAQVRDLAAALKASGVTIANGAQARALLAGSNKH